MLSGLVAGKKKGGGLFLFSSLFFSTANRGYRRPFGCWHKMNMASVAGVLLAKGKEKKSWVLLFFCTSLH
jgi:hypothetical protein